MRGFYCKFHNRFMTVDHIKRMNKGCWNCQYMIKVKYKQKRRK